MRLKSLAIKAMGIPLAVSMGALGFHAALAPVARSAEILMVREQGVYTLSVQFNGSLNVKAVLDTGASTVSIPLEVAAALAKNGTLTRRDLLPPVKMETADGRHINAPRIRIRSLRIGNYELDNVIATVSPGGSPVLLGQGVLQHFDHRYMVDTDREGAA